MTFTRRRAAALLGLGALLVAEPAEAARKARRKPGKSTKKPAQPACSQPTGPERPPPRVEVTAAEQDLAAIPGIPDARFYGDSERDFLHVVQGASGPWLSLSTGGAEGAYGAGLLAGLTAAGKRPEFAVVTGASTGALIAPYAFLGAQYDETLRKNYTEITAADVFEIAQTAESLFDTWPLKKTVATYANVELIGAVAAEHRKGRRLLVATTNLDSGRGVVWNMGAIAAAGTEQSMQLFRDVLMASSSIPGFFPPVLIEVEAGGKKFKEMHADGGTRSPLYVAPDPLLDAGTMPTGDMYLIVNMRLTPDYEVTERNMTAVMGRAITVILKATIERQILRAHAAAQRQKIGFHLALVGPEFTLASKSLFDQEYMKALYDYGRKQGETGMPFLAAPRG
jgi:patatin-like phospholipase